MANCSHLRQERGFLRDRALPSDTEDAINLALPSPAHQDRHHHIEQLKGATSLGSEPMPQLIATTGSRVRVEGHKPQQARLSKGISRSANTRSQCGGEGFVG